MPKTTLKFSDEENMSILAMETHLALLGFTKGESLKTAVNKRPENKCCKVPPEREVPGKSLGWRIGPAHGKVRE